MKIKEYGSGKEGDMADNLGSREKDDQKRKGVGARADRKYSGDMKEREEKS